VRRARQRPLAPAVLLPTRDLEVKHPLAVALEAEVARFDDAGVHRPHRDLVYIRTLHGGEIGPAGGVLRVTVRPEGRGTAVRRMKANWFEPGMALRLHTPLFANLAFEPVRLWAVGRARRVPGSARRASR